MKCLLPVCDLGSGVLVHAFKALADMSDDFCASLTGFCRALALEYLVCSLWAQTHQQRQPAES